MIDAPSMMVLPELYDTSIYRVDAEEKKPGHPKTAGAILTYQRANPSS
jgi:hypothetical protein